MLKLVDASKVYRTADVQTHALNSICLEIGAGDYVAITGPSGCGKSTLLGVLGLLDSIDAGEYWFYDKSVVGSKEDELNRLRRGRVGFIFQNFNLIDELSVFDNVALALEFTEMTKADRHDRVNTELERLGVFHRARHRPSQLSGGQQQRVAIARALVGAPSLLLADEPTGNLDSANGLEIMNILESINAQGTTVAVVTHSEAHAARAKRVIELRDGRIVGDIN